jgi:glucokinase
MSQPWFLGIEIGGTKLQLGIGPGQGSILALERLCVDPVRGAPGIREQIQSGFATLLAKANLDKRQIEAAGIGFGGPVDVLNGHARKSYQIDGWDDFPVTAWVGEHLEVPRVVLENDADTAGLAEARFGAGIGYSPILYMTVGSGIGGALIVDHQIYRGFGQGAIEIGHIRVPDSTSSSSDHVELEQSASGWAIASTARELGRRKKQEGRDDWPALTRSQGNPDQITAAMVAEAAIAGDPDSSAILDRARSAVAFALTQAITLLAPRRIVIGGGVSLLGEKLWFDPIRRLIDRDVFEPFRGRIDVVPAALGEEVVVHGALAIARDAIVRSERPEPGRASSTILH